jgi:hypothetical protein
MLLISWLHLIYEVTPLLNTSTRWRLPLNRSLAIQPGPAASALDQEKGEIAQGNKKSWKKGCQEHDGSSARETAESLK